MNRSIGKMLGDVAGRFHLYEFCALMGIESIFYRMCYKEELKVSNMFYSHNVDRIRNNANMFVEEESRKTYLKAIDFRQTHKLKDRPRFCKEKEYFNQLTKLSVDEVLIDCGAYTGDTVEQFICQSHNFYKKIVAFEPDHENFLKLLDSCRTRRGCFCVEAGVWNENSNVSFEEGRLAGSRIDIEGGGYNSRVST